MSKAQIVQTNRFQDSRGWFTETFNERRFAELGIDCRFVQDNHSLSIPRYTLRGLHFQAPPHGQAKLVRCVRGRIFDVAVDIRRDSPTFGKWQGVELSAEKGQQFFIPVGFAHGFLTLEDGCEVIYKCSALYEPASDGGVIWNDPDIAIEWPLETGVYPILSPKDEKLPTLANLSVHFPHDGVAFGPVGEG